MRHSLWPQGAHSLAVRTCTVKIKVKCGRVMGEKLTRFYEREGLTGGWACPSSIFQLCDKEHFYAQVPVQENENEQLLIFI